MPIPTEFDPLTPEQKDRFRRSVLRREVVAVRGNCETRESLKRLAASGCDLGALWFVLETYRNPNADQAFQPERAEIKIFRRKIALILRRLVRVADAIRSTRKSEPNPTSDSVFEPLGRDVKRWISDLEKAGGLSSSISNPRGPLRPEKFLAVRSELGDILDNLTRSAAAGATHAQQRY